MSYSKGFSVFPKFKKGRKSSSDDERLLQLNYISIVEIFLLGFPMLFYLAMKYYGIDDYGNFAVLLLSLGLIGIFGVALFQRRGFFKLQNYYLSSTRQMLMFLIYSFAIVVILGVAWFLVGSLLKYSLEPIELYFYYLGAGIMEEIFFRFFLCGMLKTQIINRIKIPKINQLPDVVENIIIALITALIFMLSHATSYGGDVVGMTTMFVGGVVFAMFFLYTKDISITILGHCIINFLAVGNLLIMIG